jgi:hypothetical protein
MIDGLKILADILQRIPSYKEINDCNWIPSIHCYEKRFGSFSDALEIAGLENISRTYITPLGHKALSSYEYNFLLMLEQYKLNFEQEEYYSKYIEGFKRRYRFDFTLNINKSNIFIEVFGMINIDWYKERLKHKIKICKENNLPLVYFYPSDIINKTNEELYQLLQIKIKELIREPNGSFFNVKEAI